MTSKNIAIDKTESSNPSVPIDDLEMIRITDLHKSFGDNHVLRGFNLSLHRGENVVILGKSGSGKSILIKCIVGLIKYDSGSLKVFGKEI